MEGGVVMQQGRQVLWLPYSQVLGLKQGLGWQLSYGARQRHSFAIIRRPAYRALPESREGLTL
jgi:hypothetical protein